MKEYINIGIIGCRARNSEEDYIIVERSFLSLEKYFIDKGYKLKIISGGCKKGGDRFAEIIATKFNIPIDIHYPKVDKNCSRKEYAIACYERNDIIAKESDLLIACVGREQGEGRGTEDTIKKYNSYKSPNMRRVYRV